MRPKTIENKEKRTKINLWLNRRLFSLCEFNLGRVDCIRDQPNNHHSFKHHKLKCWKESLPFQVSRQNWHSSFLLVAKHILPTKKKGLMHQPLSSFIWGTRSKSIHPTEANPNRVPVLFLDNKTAQHRQNGYPGEISVCAFRLHGMTFLARLQARNAFNATLKDFIISSDKFPNDTRY